MYWIPLVIRRWHTLLRSRRFKRVTVDKPYTTWSAVYHPYELVEAVADKSQLVYSTAYHAYGLVEATAEKTCSVASSALHLYGEKYAEASKTVKPVTSSAYHAYGILDVEASKTVKASSRAEHRYGVIEIDVSKIAKISSKAEHVYSLLDASASKTVRPYSLAYHEYSALEASSEKTETVYSLAYVTPRQGKLYLESISTSGRVSCAEYGSRPPLGWYGSWSGEWTFYCSASRDYSVARVRAVAHAAEDDVYVLRVWLALNASPLRSCRVEACLYPEGICDTLDLTPYAGYLVEIRINITARYCNRGVVDFISESYSATTSWAYCHFRLFEVR